MATWKRLVAAGLLGLAVGCGRNGGGNDTGSDGGCTAAACWDSLYLLVSHPMDARIRPGTYSFVVAGDGGGGEFTVDVVENDDGTYDVEYEPGSWGNWLETPCLGYEPGFCEEKGFLMLDVAWLFQEAQEGGEFCEAPDAIRVTVKSGEQVLGDESLAPVYEWYWCNVSDACWEDSDTERNPQCHPGACDGRRNYYTVVKMEVGRPDVDAGGTDTDSASDTGTGSESDTIADGGMDAGNDAGPEDGGMDSGLDGGK